MKNASTHTLSAFYQKLGYLFYAVAAADRHIVQEEVNALHKLVLEDWISLEKSTDQFGTDAAYQIEITFDLIRDRELSADKAFTVFEEWYHEHADLFDADVINRIHHSMSRIATAFHGANKSEMAMVYRAKALLGGGGAAL
jgi:hypothetical protein